MHAERCAVRGAQCVCYVCVCVHAYHVPPATCITPCTCHTHHTLHTPHMHTCTNSHAHAYSHAHMLGFPGGRVRPQPRDSGGYQGHSRLLPPILAWGQSQAPPQGGGAPAQTAPKPEDHTSACFPDLPRDSARPRSPPGSRPRVCVDPRLIRPLCLGIACASSGAWPSCGDSMPQTLQWPRTLQWG